MDATINTPTADAPAAQRQPASESQEPNSVPLVFRIIAVITYLYLLTPAVIVVLAGLNAGDYLRFPPDGFSLRWVHQFLTSDVFLPAYLFSLRLAFVTMVCATILGTMAAIFLTRVSFRGRGVVRALFLTPLLLPGLVIGLALYVYYLGVPIGLSRTFWGMMVGH